MCMTHWLELMFDGGDPDDMYDWGELQRQEWEAMSRLPNPDDDIQLPLASEGNG